MASSRGPTATARTVGMFPRREGVHRWRASSGARRRAIRVAGLLTLALFAALTVLSARLAADGGSTMFELGLSGTESRAREILVAWREHADGFSWGALALDTAFIPCYVGYAVLTAAAMSDRLPGGLRTPALAAAWLMLAAGALDLAENVALFAILGGSPEQPWPAIARWTSWLWIALVASAVLAFAVARRRHKQARAST